MKSYVSYRTILSIVIGIYLSIGPMYWMPWVTTAALFYAKVILLTLAFLLMLFSNFRSRVIAFPGGKKLFILFSIYVISNLPGLMFGEKDASIYRMTNTLEIFLFLFVCGSIFNSRNYEITLKTALNGFIIFGALSAITSVLHPNIINPFNDQLTLTDTGFAGSRVGWSPANALHVPWTLVYGAYFGGIFGQYISLSILLTNQILVDGRAGILASLISISGMLIYRKKSLLILIWSIALYVAVEHFDILRLLRASRVLEGHISLSSLNSASGGRVSIMSAAMRSIGRHPFIGTGFGNFRYGPHGYFVHNDYLRLATEGGVFCGVAALAIVVAGLIRGYQYAVSGGEFGKAIFFTLVCGFFVSLFEPGFIFGDFNTSSFWWFCYCICMGTKIKGSSWFRMDKSRGLITQPGQFS